MQVNAVKEPQSSPSPDVTIIKIPSHNTARVDFFLFHVRMIDLKVEDDADGTEKLFFPHKQPQKVKEQTLNTTQVTKDVKASHSDKLKRKSAVEAFFRFDVLIGKRFYL